MGILIKGIDAPRNCKNCLISGIAMEISHYGAECPYTETKVKNDKHNIYIGRHPMCPITEVPDEHGDLIDKDEMGKHLYAKRKFGLSETTMAFTVGIESAISELDNVPVIIKGGE